MFSYTFLNVLIKKYWNVLLYLLKCYIKHFLRYFIIRFCQTFINVFHYTFLNVSCCRISSYSFPSMVLCLFEVNRWQQNIPRYEHLTNMLTGGWVYNIKMHLRNIYKLHSQNIKWMKETIILIQNVKVSKYARI